MIRSRGFPQHITPLFLYQQDKLLKAHATYKQAKAGEQNAALELVLVPVKKYVQLIKERFDDEFTKVLVLSQPPSQPTKPHTWSASSQFPDLSPMTRPDQQWIGAQQQRPDGAFTKNYPKEIIIFVR